jgi:cyclohexanecarboxyl-CoA dehydrogenase
LRALRSPSIFGVCGTRKAPGKRSASRLLVAGQGRLAERSTGLAVKIWQDVTFPLAEAETMVEAARLLCFKTLAAKDAGAPHTREAAMCKWRAPKLAFEVVQTCLLVHGHAGHSTDLPFEQRLRDVLGLQIGDGAAQIMKLIIAREALRTAAT